MSSFMHIRPVGAELFHLERGTDMMELTLDLRNFLNVPKNPVLTSQKKP